MATNSLGTLTVFIDANLDKFRGKLTALTNEINTFNKKIQATGIIPPKTVEQTGDKVVGSLGKMQDGMKLTGMTVDKEGNKVIFSARKMGEGMQQGAKSGIAGLLSLQSFVGKIVHYITFSIGVQMVMNFIAGHLIHTLVILHL